MSKVVVFDAITQTEIIRDMTEEELAQDKIDKANAAAQAQAEVKLAEAKIDLLNRIGITADEAKLLLS
jgi:hypothetical protein